MSDEILVLFAKAPRPGRAKTRLAATVGDERAIAIYRELVESTCRAVATSRASERIVYYAPADGADEVRAMCGREWPHRPQAEGDLGARMGGAFRDQLAGRAAARMLLVGTDCPRLTGPRLDAAFDALGAAPLVFGPSDDGGYYLVGMTTAGVERAVPAVFDGIAWSTETVLAETLERARAAGLEPALLDELGDIDTEADYDRWQATLGGEG